MKKDIISDIGNNLFSIIYEILNKHLSDNMLNYDYDKLVSLIKAKLINNFETNLIDLGIYRLPDIYCVILSSRQKITCF